jgi:hypothetical protein
MAGQLKGHAGRRSLETKRWAGGSGLASTVRLAASVIARPQEHEEQRADREQRDYDESDEGESLEAGYE